MRLYVWRGGQVLKNYASGMVVVAAPSMGEAWAKLRAENLPAWFKLAYGNHHGWLDTEQEVELVMADEDFETEAGFPLRPEVFEIDQLPVLVMNGGE